VPDSVKQLLASQCARGTSFTLEQFDRLSSDELLKKLEKISRTTTKSISHPPYALTADNLLKMALIVSINLLFD
jgi:hypothetical protein